MKDKITLYLNRIYYQPYDFTDIVTSGAEVNLKTLLNLCKMCISSMAFTLFIYRSENLTQLTLC